MNAFSLNSLKDLQKYIPDKERLKALLPVAIPALLAMLYACYVALAIVPNLRVMNQKSVQLASIREQLKQVNRARQQGQQQEQNELQRAQKILQEKEGLFLTKAQAAQVIDRLYQYVNQQRVMIISLQSQPSPQEKGARYDVETFRLQVEGALPDLLRFVAQVKASVASKAFSLNNVSIVKSEDTHLLTMDIILYTSLYASPEGMMELEASVSTTLTSTASSEIAHESLLTPTPGLSAYLVKPKDWPADWPWPPEAPSVAPATATPSLAPTAPPSPEQATEPEYLVYTVQSGNTLFSIARRYGTTVEAIMLANGLSEPTIYVGQQLRIPAP